MKTKKELNRIARLKRMIAIDDNGKGALASLNEQLKNLTLTT